METLGFFESFKLWVDGRHEATMKSKRGMAVLPYFIVPQMPKVDGV